MKAIPPRDGKGKQREEEKGGKKNDKSQLDLSKVLLNNPGSLEGPPQKEQKGKLLVVVVVVVYGLP